MSEEKLEKYWNKVYYDYLEREEAQELIDYYKNMEQENQKLRKALKSYEEGKYQEHLKIQMAIDYIKNVMAHNSSNDIASRKRLLEILGGNNEE